MWQRIQIVFDEECGRIMFVGAGIAGMLLGMIMGAFVTEHRVTEKYQQRLETLVQEHNVSDNRQLKKE